MLSIVEIVLECFGWLSVLISGVHRMFEGSVSKIRSLRMDTKVWSPSLLEVSGACSVRSATLP